MRFKFVFSPSLAIDTGRTQNIGYDHDQVIAALSRLDGQGHSHELIDSAHLSDEAREKFIADVRYAFVHPSSKGRKLGNAFGTNEYKWQDFGKGIPALLVYDGDRCVDAYPHNESHGTETITEYLTRATA